MSVDDEHWMDDGLDISEPLHEILRRLGLDPNLVQSIEIYRDRVYITSYADPKRLEAGEPVLNRSVMGPINTAERTRKP